jgi:hypothetical protein
MLCEGVHYGWCAGGVGAKGEQEAAGTAGK